MSDDEILSAQQGSLQREVNNMLLRWIIKILCGIMTIVAAGTGTVVWTGITDHFKLAEMVGKLDLLIRSDTDLVAKQDRRIDAAGQRIGELSARVTQVEGQTKSRFTLTDAREHDYRAQAALNSAGLKVDWPISSHSSQ